jgi:hypothetical protein
VILVGSEGDRSVARSILTRSTAPTRGATLTCSATFALARTTARRLTSASLSGSALTPLPKRWIEDTCFRRARDSQDNHANDPQSMQHINPQYLGLDHAYRFGTTYLEHNTPSSNGNRSIISPIIHGPG